jgi:hypothetical protein
MKGEFKVVQNTEFESVNEDYVVNNPSQQLQVVLRDQLQVHIELSTMLPPNLVIPSDASDAAVAGYFNNPASLTRGVTDNLYGAKATVIGLTEDVADLETIASDHEGRLDDLEDHVLRDTDFDLKGDILVGTGENTWVRLPRGSNDKFPRSDSAEPTGILWAYLSPGDIPSLPASRITSGTFADARMPIRLNNDGRGTTAQRDAYFGVPATDAARVALANIVPTWFNTDTQREEIYYAVTGTTGLTVPGLHTSGFTAGWYNAPAGCWGGKSGPQTYVSPYIAARHSKQVRIHRPDP